VSQIRKIFLGYLVTFLIASMENIDENVRQEERERELDERM
jgi:hypothetical protein